MGLTQAEFEGTLLHADAEALEEISNPSPLAILRQIVDSEIKAASVHKRENVHGDNTKREQTIIPTPTNAQNAFLFSFKGTTGIDLIIPLSASPPFTK